MSRHVTPASQARREPTGASGQPGPGSPSGSWSCTPKKVLWMPDVGAADEEDGVDFGCLAPASSPSEQPDSRVVSTTRTKIVGTGDEDVCRSRRTVGHGNWPG